MAISKPSSVSINGMDLKPAPFVSTSYEYNKSGNYIIGGFLIVNLKGTIVGKNSAELLSQMSAISALQTSAGCVNLVIGCQGGADFLEGQGRVRDVSINKGDQPFLLSYTITIAIESIGGSPAVEPDEDFLTRYCLTKEQAKFILSYEENLSIEGDASVITSNDGGFGVSKSYIKGKGSISVTAYGREICGVPSFDGIKQALDLIRSRANTLMNFQFCDSSGHPLQAYSGFSKWLDSKQLEINDSGNIIWSFDVYLSLDNQTPYALVDIDTDDSFNYIDKKQTRTVRGSIKGLSTSTADFLNNKANQNERISNATRALSVVLPLVISGEWPGQSIELSGEEGVCKPPDDCEKCENDTPKVCYQRISSNISKSIVSGEITFSAEYGDIDNCKPNDKSLISIDIEENFPSKRYVEFIIPNAGKAVIQVFGDTPAKATITVRGDLNLCDEDKINEVIACVDAEFGKATGKYRGWIQTAQSVIIETYAYAKKASFIQCDS